MAGLVKSCFVTVGSTEFQALVEAALAPSTQLALAGQGFSRLVVQYGHSRLPSYHSVEGLAVEVWRFSDGIEDAVASADLVISHAGQAHCTIPCCS